MSSGLEETKELEDKEKKPGILSIVSMDKDERDVFLDYMDSVNPGLNASYLFAILGDDNLLKYFDVMSGTTIKVPTRDTILKVVNYIKIYNYCKSKGFTKESYEKAAKIYERRVMSIQRIIEKVERVLSKRKEDKDE